MSIGGLIDEHLDTYLLAQAITNDACLLEGGILVEGVGQHVVRHIVTQVTDE